MSRSFGERSLTTSPPIFSSPLEMSSSPAIMRSAVDFPQPDGPTRITNSPSAMSRLRSFTASKPSGYRLVTWSRTISDMRWLSFSLALDGARRQAGHDAALEDQHHDDDGNGDHDRRSGDGAGRLLELRRARELRERRGNGLRAFRRGQRDREHEVVPREDE